MLEVIAAEMTDLAVELDMLRCQNVTGYEVSGAWKGADAEQYANYLCDFDTIIVSLSQQLVELSSLIEVSVV